MIEIFVMAIPLVLSVTHSLGQLLVRSLAVLSSASSLVHQ